MEWLPSYTKGSEVNRTNTQFSIVPLSNGAVKVVHSHANTFGQLPMQCAEQCADSPSWHR